MDYQVIVIGAGPGGYPAAIRAAQLGARVCLIETGQPGGTCLNRGCIPTKALVAGASLLKQVRRAREFGIETGEVSLNPRKMRERQEGIVSRLRQGIRFLLEKHKIDFLEGKGRLLGPGRVEVRRKGSPAETVTGEKIIVATGSEPLLPPALGYDGKVVVSSTEMLQLDAVPESLVIVGAGVIGCEFAGIYAELGSRVTLVEAERTILPFVEEELARKLQGVFRQSGITLRTRTKIREVKREGSRAKVYLEDGTELDAEKVLVAVGRSLNTRGLGLEECGVELGPRGEIVVNERMETSAPGIYAAGDVTGKALLAHVATCQGLVAAANALGEGRKMNYQAVPNAIFTFPEIGTVGLTSQEAKGRGIPCKTGKFPFLASGKALCEGEADGFVKVLAREGTGEILGIHIIGPHATELVAEGALAVRWGLTLGQLAETVHAHPTLAEALKEAAEAAEGLGLHV
ncbi:MAG: dihydrolipoyl dehydrogenase [Firmicutes bacterium]|nr:dihydrolipoyl dehydrogenase [Bacillota bacterium]